MVTPGTAGGHRRRHAGAYPRLRTGVISSGPQFVAWTGDTVRQPPPFLQNPKGQTNHAFGIEERIMLRRGAFRGFFTLREELRPPNAILTTN